MNSKKLKSYVNAISINKHSLCTIVGIFVLASLFKNANAQTFPPASSCTSKDLELVSVSLPGNNICNSCVAGSTVTRTLNIAINNKTGSTRTSFAFWGTLQIFNDDGTLDSAASGPRTVCVGPLPRNIITNFVTSLNITFHCGQSLRFTNLYLAWTDASPSSTCPTLLNSPSTINPKCGTLPFIQINAGVNASTVITSTTCTSLGSIAVTPFGGKSPYTVTLGATTFTNVTTSATFSNLPVGTYTITITDANNCVTTKSRAVTATSNLPVAPTSGGDQIQCALSPLQTLTATASVSGGATLNWYSAASGGNLISSPILNTTGTITYYAEASLGTCVSAARTPVLLTIKPVADAPVSGGNQSECQASPLQTLTATATGSNISWYDASVNGNAIANPVLNAVGSVTYYAEATLNSCKSRTRTAVSLTIQPAPTAPVSGGNQTECALNAIQTLTATASGTNVSWYDSVSGGNNVANPIRNSIGSITYYAESLLGSCKSLTRTPVTLTINQTPAAPVSGGDQTECALSPIQTLTATATGSSVSWYDAPTAGNTVSNPIRNSIGTITYYAESIIGTCKSLTRTLVTLTINPTPSVPISGSDQTQCALSPIQTLAAVATGSNVTWYNAQLNGSLITNPILNAIGSVTYYAQATLGSCVSIARTPVTLTINPLPSAAEICAVQPSLCGPATGSITILSPLGPSYQYSINNGLSWQTSPSFPNLAAGSVTGVLVNDVNGCISSSVSCDASECQQGRFGGQRMENGTYENTVGNNLKMTSKPAIRQDIGISVFPNPFNDKVKFTITLPESGNCELAIYNVMGQKVKTVLNGFLASGSNLFEIDLPDFLSGYFIYNFKMGDKQLTGKLLKTDR